MNPSATVRLHRMVLVLQSRNIFIKKVFESYLMIQWFNDVMI